MRRSLGIALPVIAALLALAAAGCGGPSGTTPAACLDGTSAYLGALGEAPGEVRLRGETPISDCLAENQGAGDLATVGGALVRVATMLDSRARAEPGRAANLQLGYLLGAARRGADRTGGIHAELLRRLTTAARYSPDNGPLSPTFLHAYRTGYAAGKRDG
jgi:hypothetical protein